MAGSIELLENTDVQQFEYLTGPVRIVIKNGEPWFVLRDLCDRLEIEKADRVKSRLEGEDTHTASILTPGGIQQMTIVSEAGMYEVVLVSRKPEAREFKRWLTHEVIPQIRKTGSYSVAEPLDDLDIAIETLKELKRQRKEMRALKETVEKINNAVSWIDQGYQTVLGWYNSRRLVLSHHERSRLGKLASAVSRNLELIVMEVPDQRFGAVKAYAPEVFEELEASGEVRSIHRNQVTLEKGWE